MPSMMFMIFAGLAILSALSVILIKHPVKAVFSLIMCFVTTAASWLLMDAEFLAWTLILVYVGAVMVLFVFVVMMLNLRALVSNFGRWVPIGLAVTTVLVCILLYEMQQDHMTMPQTNTLAYVGAKLSNAALLGATIFTQYLAQFVIAGVVLLVAMVAAIALIYRGPHNRKIQNISAQINANPRQRVELVDG